MYFASACGLTCKVFIPLVLLCGPSLVAGEPDSRQFRIWTSPDGHKSEPLAIQDYYHDSGTVILVNQAGKQFRTELTRLSDTDQHRIVADGNRVATALVNTAVPQASQVSADAQRIENLGLPKNQQAVYARPRESTGAPIQVVTMKTVTKTVQVPYEETYQVLVPEVQMWTVMAPVQQRIRCVERYGLFKRHCRVVYRTQTVMRPVTRQKTVIRSETRSKTVMRSETRTEDIQVSSSVKSIAELGGVTKRQEGIELPAPLSAGAISREVVKVFEKLIENFDPPVPATSFNPRGVNESIIDYEQPAAYQGMRYLMRVEINQLNPRKITLETGALDVNDNSQSIVKNDTLFKMVHDRLTK